MKIPSHREVSLAMIQNTEVLKKKFNYITTKIELKDKHDKTMLCLKLTADKGISFLYTQISV